MRIRTHTNPFNYFRRLEPLDLSTIFPKNSDQIEIEVGFGRGVFLRHYATLFPERNILGIEVRKSPVTILQKRILPLGLQNTHLIHGNAHIVLEDCIKTPCINALFIFHPDPWFKKRHHKRRVVNPKFLTMLQPKLRPKAKLYISTDVPPLFDAMIETIDATNTFKKIEDKEFWERIYHSHWNTWSKKDNRTINTATFEYQG